MSFQTRFVILVALIGSFLWALPAASAQSPVELESLEIALWPEFDRAGVLVLIDGALGPDTPLPATLTLRLPAEPFAVAEQAPDGALMNAQFATAAAGQGFDVTLTLQQPSFRVEYYDPTLTIAGDTRAYTYAWLTPVAVGSASIRIQQPAGASGFGLTPDFGASAVGEYGLSYYQMSLGALSAGAPISATLGYTKSGSALTIEQVDIGSQPVVAATPGTSATVATDNSTWLAAGAAALAAVPAVAAGVVYWRSRRPGVVSRKRANPAGTVRRTRRQTPNANPPSAIGTGSAARRFCTQCGQPISGDDRFCRKCGASVKA